MIGEPEEIRATSTFLTLDEGTLKTLEQAWLRPRYDGYMYFLDVGGAIINKY